MNNVFIFLDGYVRRLLYEIYKVYPRRSVHFYFKNTGSKDSKIVSFADYGFKNCIYSRRRGFQLNIT